MSEDLQAKLKILRQGYLEKLKGTVQEMKILLDAECLDIEEIYSRVHKIAGTSGMYGLVDLSEISTEFEIYLKVEKENMSAVNQKDLRSRLSGYINRIEENLTGE